MYIILEAIPCSISRILMARHIWLGCYLFSSDCQRIRYTMDIQLCFNEKLMNIHIMFQIQCFYMNYTDKCSKRRQPGLALRQTTSSFEGLSIYLMSNNEQYDADGILFII